MLLLRIKLLLLLLLVAVVHILVADVKNKAATTYSNYQLVVVLVLVVDGNETISITAIDVFEVVKK